MAITYFFVSVALLVLVSAFLVGYYVGREKARQDSYDSLTGWKLIKEGHFNCPFYTPEGYSGGCIAPDPAQNKAWNGGMEKHGMYWIFDEAGMRKFMHDITGRDELPYKVGE